MQAKHVVPVVTVDQLTASRTFYVDVLGFEIAFDHAQYLGVRAGGTGGPELGFMLPDPDAPQVFSGQGVTLAFTVDDADQECRRLEDLGITIAERPTDQPWGARAFTIVDPSGIALLISHPIPMAPEFAGSMP